VSIGRAPRSLQRAPRAAETICVQPQTEPGLVPGVAAGSRSADALLRGIRIVGAPAALVSAASAWLLLRGVDHRFISFSDGAYMYAASEAATHGFHSLYRTIALSLPPGVPLGAALVWRVWPEIESIRVVLALLSVGTALLTYRAGRTLFALSSPWAAVASLVALTAPVHAQFVGLEGELIITPLALLLALTLEQRRVLGSLLVMAAGFLFKLTWAPFFVAGVAALVPRLGRRAAVLAALCALAAAAMVYGLAIRAFGWSAHDLVAQLVLAQTHSGLQLELASGLILATVVLWWPFLALAPMGLASATRSTRYVTAAGAVSALYMVKQGTFFNVLDPLEPFLSLIATAGARALWHRRPRWGRALVVACAAGVAVHVASVSAATLTRALPIPLGAAVVNTDNERAVDRLAHAVDAHSTPRQPVLVNPLVALVAQRREAAGAADWFILRALAAHCRSGRVCGEWSAAKRLARRARVPVVSVDSNVVSFDPSFRRDVGLGTFRRVIRVDAPPLKTAIYARAVPRR
jgi:hypothetical protein